MSPHTSTRRFMISPRPVRRVAGVVACAATLMIGSCLLNGCRNTAGDQSKSNRNELHTESKRVPPNVESLPVPGLNEAVANETTTETTPETKLDSRPGSITESLPVSDIDETVPVTRQQVPEHAETSRFTDKQLVKDHTLFVLAFDSVTRQTYFLANYRPFMREDQVEKTRDLIDSYDPRFTRLRNDRQKILENATDDQDIQMMLKNNRIDTLLLAREIRRAIFRTILTKEQKKAHQASIKTRRKKNQRRDERKNEDSESPENGKNHK